MIIMQKIKTITKKPNKLGSVPSAKMNVNVVRHFLVLFLHLSVLLCSSCLFFCKIPTSHCHSGFLPPYKCINLSICHLGSLELVTIFLSNRNKEPTISITNTSYLTVLWWTAKENSYTFKKQNTFGISQHFPLSGWCVNVHRASLISLLSFIIWPVTPHRSGCPCLLFVLFVPSHFCFLQLSMPCVFCCFLLRLQRLREKTDVASSTVKGPELDVCMIQQYK